ncbi:patatin-like phospholipase family protein [Methylobacterium sp. R2-1]|uniref:patatin-like phospholipase family protein n=1 Tax=Methylobacterium sp. R2-1 TaxID=2587064 RepID=UPI00178FE2C2|nr:patatin-like phospholipase family protein [Methylobacterium sp. R2-1]MBB2962282.1 hypothetical protein [Methylobacterium sp. R2-1]
MTGTRDDTNAEAKVTSGARKDDVSVIDTQAALEEEWKCLGLAENEQPTALCLSGGGIRSATFCLGAIQALAKHGLLKEFHYLSTVSGGGYIGGWLTRLISSQADRGEKPIHIGATESLIASRDGTREAEAVRRLRRFSNFLTPHPGFASLDTWAGIVLWVRNTLINWLLLLPAFTAVVAVPLFYFALSSALVASEIRMDFDILAGVIAVLGLSVACYQTILGLPSHSHEDDIQKLQRLGPGAKVGWTGRQAAYRIVLPMLLWCLLSPLAVTGGLSRADGMEEGRAVFIPASDAATNRSKSCPLVEAPCVITAAIESGPASDDNPFWSPSNLWVLAAASFVASLLAYGAAYLNLKRRAYPTEENRKAHLAPFRNSTLAWLASCAASAALIWYGTWLVRDLDVFWLALAGPAWVALSEVLRSTLYVAFRRKGIRADLDREWLARLNAIKVLVILTLAATGAVVVLGGVLVGRLEGLELSGLTSGGLAAGWLATQLGKSAQTQYRPAPASGSSPLALLAHIPVTLLIQVGIVLFGAILLALIGRLIAVLAGALAVGFTDSRAEPPFLTIALLVALIGLGAVILAWWLGSLININRFSMHAVYRNRIVRGFLGSARREADSHPDHATSFDVFDNVRMADAFKDRSPKVLFPVINVALNRTSGKDTARAERKAESFTITPLRCGAATLDLRASDGFAGQEPAGAFIATADYAGDERQTGPGEGPNGISLGTAITISGAAASPNMGYHSSPLVAFVMTLFNVRLGAWLPNPGARRLTHKQLKSSGPVNSLPALLLEMLGRSDRDSDYVYLSDGGHFDNLGLYEMLRRRCRFILVIDASQDKDYGYEDLSRTIQNARIDMAGLEIVFDPMIRIAAKELRTEGAWATISYPTPPDATDEQKQRATGRLLYVKPWMITEETPLEVTAFQVRKPSFPHESTGNQFFTESDFESYRRLGETVMNSVINSPNLGKDFRAAMGSGV